MGKRTGEKLSGWLRIGQFSVPSAELSRTSSSSPSRLLQPLPDNLSGDSGGAQRGTANDYSQRLLLQATNVRHNRFHLFS
ncbi:MAG TPA: hypothetical protein VF311_07175, partial [Terriglobales bacterium]